MKKFKKILFRLSPRQLFFRNFVTFVADYGHHSRHDLARSCSLLESFVSKKYFFLFWLARLISFWGTLVRLGVRLLSSLQTNDFFLFQSHHPCKFNTQSAWSSFSFEQDEMQKKSLYSAPVINRTHVKYTFFHMWYKVVFVVWKFDGINPRQKFGYGEVVYMQV